MYNFKKAFTLIELLIVIAIIVVLAGVVLVKISSSTDQSKTAAALQTMRSAFPYATECYMRTIPLNIPSPITNATSTVMCTIAGIASPKYPDLNKAKTGYSYSSFTATTYVATGAKTITCDTALGKCTAL